MLHFRLILYRKTYPTFSRLGDHLRARKCPVSPPNYPYRETQENFHPDEPHPFVPISDVAAATLVKKDEIFLTDSHVNNLRFGSGAALLCPSLNSRLCRVHA